MKKRFLLATMAVMVVGIGCSGCGLKSGEGIAESEVLESVQAEAEEYEIENQTQTLGISTENAVKGDVGEKVEKSETVPTESVTEAEKDLETSDTDAGEATGTESDVQETNSKETTRTEKSTPEITEPKKESTEVAEQSSEPEPTENVTEPSTEKEDKFVAYNPEYVVALATEKTKAYGKILIADDLNQMLANGEITQEEYDEYYPYDGTGYYNVFVETDLNRASTTSGRLLNTEDGIAEYIAGMLALETGPYFAIEYAGIYKGTDCNFYEFRCHR